MPRALWAKAPFILVRHPASFAALVCAAALVAMGAASGPLMNAGAASEALQNKLNQLSPLAAGLTIERPGRRDRGGIAGLAAADGRRRSAALALGRTLPSVGRPILTTTSLAALTGASAAGGNPLVVVVMARDGAKAHVTPLARGRAGVWLPTSVARPLRLAPGDEIAFARPPLAANAGPVRLRIGGVYRQLDTDLGNPYWVNFTARIRSRNPDKPLPPPFVLVDLPQSYLLAHATGLDELANTFEFPVDPHALTIPDARATARSFARVQRSIAARSPLAARLGCTPGPGECRVSSSLVAAQRLATESTAGLQPVITLLAGFSLLIGLAAALVAGAFTARRRAAEARLSLVGGEAAPAFAARAALEALLPCALGAAVGGLIAVAVAEAFTPHGAVDASVLAHVRRLVVLLAVGSLVVVAAGATLARGRLARHDSRWSFVRRFPWELPVAVAAAALWIVVRSGNGLVRNAGSGAHPRIIVLLLPALAAAAAAGVASRVLRALLRRARGDGSSPAVFLALRRVAAARGLVTVLVVTVAMGAASLAFAIELDSTLVANAVEKAYASNGSDVQGIVDSGRVLPPGFPFPVTSVVESFGSARVDGRPVEVMLVDPSTLQRVLRAHWPRSVVSAVGRLGDSRSREPAIATGLSTGRHVLDFGGRLRAVDVVASPRAFPGMIATQPLIVLRNSRRNAAAAGGLTYIWASGPPRAVEAALVEAHVDARYLTVVKDFVRGADVNTITNTYGFLKIVALAAALIALVALVLYLRARARAQIVTAEFLRRMGLPTGRQAASIAIEAAVLVGLSVAIGLAAALVTAGVVVSRVDPIPQYPPSASAVVPWAELVLAAGAAVAVAAAVAVVATAAVRRRDVGEALRVA